LLPASGLPLDSLGPPRQVAIENNGHQDRRTDNCLQPESVDSKELNPVLQDSENHCTKSRAVNRSTAAKDAYPSDYDGRNRLEMEIGRDNGIHRSKASAPEHPNESAQ
jgi:hypothetical protein